MARTPDETPHINRYEDETRIREKLAVNRHRLLVGGLWSEMSALQMQALHMSGLTPDHAVLDVGAGSLRLGHTLVDFLEPRRYFGTDMHESLMQAGYDRELSAAQRERLPRSHLKAARVEDPIPFDGPFDRMMAWSLFTHLPERSVRSGLAQMRDRLTSDGTILATFFLADDGAAGSIERDYGIVIVTYPDRDPYHYTLTSIEAFARDAGLRYAGIMDVEHPRGQSVLAFKMEDAT